MLPVKVVALDNDRNELDLAIKGLSMALMPVLPLLYDSLSGVDHLLQEPLHGVRIVFCDINLTETSGTLNASQVTGSIAEALGKIVSLDNGPYALIFWSKHTDLVNGIQEQFIQRYNDILAPSIIGRLDKNHLPVGTDDMNQQNENIKYFTQKLKEILTENPVMELLFRWETLCAKSSTETTNSLYKVSCPENSWENVGENGVTLASTLKKIAEETIGIENLPSRSAFALKEGLTPLLHDNLQNLNDDNFDQLAKKIIEDVMNGKNETPIDSASLNTFYHIGHQHVSPDERGSFIFVDESPKSQFATLFQHEWRDIASEFYTLRSGKAEKEGVTKDALEEALLVGVIEISPACDHAQSKNRNHRYLLTALLPDKYLKVVTAKGQHEGVHSLPTVFVNRVRYSPRVNFRYTIGLSSDHQVLKAPQFRLREQLMNDINFRFAQHAARPGIVSFWSK